MVPRAQGCDIYTISFPHLILLLLRFLDDLFHLFQIPYLDYIYFSSSCFSPQQAGNVGRI